MQEPDAYPPLDYPRVKEDLSNGPDKRKALLLQAIRWVSKIVSQIYYHEHLYCITGILK